MAIKPADTAWLQCSNLSAKAMLEMWVWLSYRFQKNE